MNDIAIPLSGGRVTSRDAADLAAGELREAKGVYYKPGDPSRVYTLQTRQLFGLPHSAGDQFKGLVICQFDDSTVDKIVAFIGTDLYLADAGGSGAFVAAGLTLVGTGPLSAAFADPRWYLATNGDQLYVLESTGTIYRAGMQKPDVQPVITQASAAVSVSQPTAVASASGWLDTSKAADSDLATFAYRTTTTFASFPQVWSWATGGAASRTLSVTWSIAGSAGMQAFVVIEYSIDGGANWVPWLSPFCTAPTGQATTTVSISAALTSVQVRAYVLENAIGIPVTMKVHDIRAVTGSSVVPFTLSAGLYYAFGEYDSSRGHYSSVGPSSVLQTGTLATATMPLPTAAKNARSTHWVVWRTADGGTAPQDLGILATLPIAETSYTDDFSVYASSVQPLPTVDLLNVDGELFPVNDQPPLLGHVNFFRGALVGVTTTGTLAYSEDGLPESWPTINLIPRGQFPFPEHDVPRGTMTVGDVLVILCDGSVVTLNALPRVVNGQFNNAELTPMRGQSGVVGTQAFCTYSVSGEPRGAWVSPYGTAVTNGQTADRISDDMDWESEKGSNPAQTLLRWLPDKLALELVVDRTTAYLLHVGEKHAKPSGAKVTRALAPISCLAGALVGGVFRLFAGHATDGKVYREQYAGAEAGVISPGLIFGQGREFEIYKMRLRHSGFGSTDTAIVSCTMRRDDFPGSASPVAVGVSLAGDKGSEFYVGRAGEYADISITTSGAGSLLDLKARTRTMGAAGRVAV